jgi:serine/threonine protein kinase
MHFLVFSSLHRRKKRYVAIKALTGMATNLHDRGFMQELPVMQCVSKLIQWSGQPAHCAVLRSHFVHPGKPNDGNHLCLVMDVLGGDIEALQSDSKAYPVPLAKRILRDSLCGLSQLHASGCVHTGACICTYGLIWIIHARAVRRS